VTKVGVVGVGSMGQNHVRLYSQMKCELVGVADNNIDSARQIGRMYEIPYYPDYRELLGKVDAVSIAVPTTLHHSVAMDFLESGVHCLVEKPISFSLEEADDLIRAAENNQVTLAIGHIEHFNPAVIKLKQKVDEGALGKLLIISTRRVGPYVPRIRDVGIVIDSATHDIGVIRYLLGKNAISVFSRVGSLKHSKEDHAIIVLDFGGTTACVEVNWLTPKKVRTLIATGSEGSAYLNYIEQELIISNSHGENKVDVPKTEPLKLELEAFLKNVAEGSKPEVDGRAGREILQLASEGNHNNFYNFMVTKDSHSLGVATHK
jgi:UDP-N-acetylglucosamine 3-dehydrogenase